MDIKLFLSKILIIDTSHFGSVKSMSSSKGFTLVELLVVIAIIAILGVVAIAAINPAVRINSSKDARAFASVQTISKSLEACYLDRISAGDSAAAKVSNCCGAASGSCVSQTSPALGLYKYGYGFPTGFGAVAVNTNGATICVSQQRGTDANYNKYTMGGGSIVTNAASACSNGV